MNFNERASGLTPELIIIHYTDTLSLKRSLALLAGPDAMVSAHYLIGEDGAIHPLVAEDKRAWHAGVSAWRGMDDINSRSIGIELQHPGHQHGYRPFAEAQIASLIMLCQDLMHRWPRILPGNVLGHGDIAPGRKIDPGPLFPWQLLASEGLGLWPGEPAGGTQPATLAEALSQFGYAIGTSHPAARPLPVVRQAFLDHFAPEAEKEPPTDTALISQLTSLIEQRRKQEAR